MLLLRKDGHRLLIINDILRILESYKQVITSDLLRTNTPAGPTNGLARVEQHGYLHMHDRKDYVMIT